MNCHKMFNISGEVIKFTENTMESWRVELTGDGQILALLNIRELSSSELHYLH